MRKLLTNLTKLTIWMYNVLMMKKNKNILAVIIIIIVLVGVIVSVPERGVDKPMKIGVLIPLTGNVAKTGQDLLVAVKIAQADLKEKYPNIEIVVEDSEFSPSKSVSAFTKLVNVDGVVGVIGEINSSSVEAQKPVAANLKAVMLAPGGAASYMDKYVYKNSHEASKEGAAVAEFSFRKGNRRAAVLYMDNDFGKLEKDSFVEEFKRLGGEVVTTESFAINGSTDYRSQLTKIKSYNPDALFIVNLGGLVGVATKQVQTLGISADLYGQYATESSDLISSGGSSLEGFVYSFPITTVNQTKEQKEFVEKFKAEVGGVPPLLAYNIYDMYSMLAKSADACNGDRECINKDFASKTEFTGVGGTVKINKENQLERPFYFRKIVDGKIIEVQ